jgi:hypothetical protein
MKAGIAKNPSLASYYPVFEPSKSRFAPQNRGFLAVPRFNLKMQVKMLRSLYAKVLSRGVNLTFVSPMPQSRRTNVTFKNATRNLSLLVVLEISTFGRGHGAMGAKCRSRTTRGHWINEVNN